MPRIVFMLCVLTLLAGRAGAQGLPWQGETRTTAGWVFTPGVAGGVAWDSGIQSDGNPVVDALFQKWVGRVNPRVQIDFNGRRSHLSAGYSGAVEKYRGSDSAYEQYSQFSASQTLSPRVSMSGSGTYNVAPTTDRLFVTDATVPLVESHSTWVDATGVVRWRAAEHTNVQGGYRFSRVTFDQDQSFQNEWLTEGHSHAPFLTILHTVSTRLTMGGSAEYRRENVENGQPFDVQTATAQFAYRLSGDTTVTGGGGVSRLRLIYIGLQTTAPTAHLAVDHRVRRLRIGGSVEHAFVPIYGFGTMAMTDTFSGYITTPLLDRRYYLSGNVSYSRGNPTEDVGIGFNFDTLWLSASVGRRLAPWLSAEGYVTVSQQDSASQASTDRTRVGVQFVTSKPMRIE